LIDIHEQEVSKVMIRQDAIAAVERKRAADPGASWLATERAHDGKEGKGTDLSRTQRGWIQHALLRRSTGVRRTFLMWKRVLVLAVTTGAALALAAPSFADTTVNAKASFTEGIAKQFGCTAPPGPFGVACGAGNMVPFGSATEFIQFGAGGVCAGGPCDLRTITVAQGTLVLNEAFSSPDCPGQCNPGHGRASHPGNGTLTDTVVGGSGIFVDAIGDVLTGSVKGAGGSTQIQLAGPLTVVP
jgi:hypothetical protein